MSLPKFAALLVLAAVALTALSPVADAANKRRIASRGIRAGLVPPPPAYMPTILPELYYRGGVQQATTTAVEKKEENPLTQYVQNRSGEEVKAISTRKGVSTWAPLRVKKPS